MIQLTEMVVTKGRTVIHDDKTYEQHSRVRLPKDEAERLQAAGFVVPISTVRQALHDVGGDLDIGAQDEDTGNDGVGEPGEQDEPSEDVVADEVRKRPGRPKAGDK